MQDLLILKEFIREALLDEAKKKSKKKKAAKNRAAKKGKKKSSQKKKKPGNKNYYTGTRKSNKSMEREINKCKGPNPPKSCYDYWSADKEYDKAKGKKK